MRWLLFTVLSLLLPASVQASPEAKNNEYWTPKTLLADFFKSSERVTYVKVETSRFADELKTKLGHLPERATSHVFVATTKGVIDGYAFIDDELGQHQPITFGVKIDPDGRVERLEVMVYREPYGDEVREPRFRKQFVNKQERDPVRLGEDIAAISGATISSKSMAIGVRRALVMVGLVRQHGLAK